MASSVFVTPGLFSQSGGSVTINGVVTVSATALTSTVPYLAPNGSAAAPSLSFAGDATQGFSRSGSSLIIVSFAGNTAFELQRSGTASIFNLNSDTAAVRWGVLSDVVLSRGAADRLDLATGDSLYLVSGGLGVGVTPPAAGMIGLTEQTAPSAPAANAGTLFLVDNGAGKTVLKIQFATGAAQTIATEP